MSTHPAWSERPNIIHLTPQYGYMPENTEYTAFWRQRDKAFARRLAAVKHRNTQLAILKANQPRKEV